MPAWTLAAGGAAAAEWFTQRFLRARALMPSANFDTILGTDFQETITCELVNVDGVCSADAATLLVRAGVVEVTAGNNAVGGSGSLQLTGSGAHVQLQNAALGGPWYIAGLSKVLPPSDKSGSAADMIGVTDDADNRVALGLRGSASTTNWIGYILNAAAETDVVGPALDPDEGPVWHLFEIWNDEALIHFAIDGVEFASTASAAAAAATFGKLRARTASSLLSLTSQYDKWCAVVKSMQIGQL